MKCKIALLRIGLMGLIACSAAESSPFEYRAIRMGTEARILVHAGDEAHAARAAAAAFGRIAFLDSLLSDYRIDSELAAVAASAGGAPLAISHELGVVLARALQLALETDGAFDPTIGPVSVLWREARAAGGRPDSLALGRARKLVDWRRVELDTLAGTVRLGRPGMRLDLGAIAKGYAADEALAVLREHDLPSALIVFGGEIVAGDAPPGRAGWTVRSGVRADSAFVLAGNALSTSSDDEQFVIVDGERYSHVVDARTGIGLTGGESATVLARDGLTADGLATAVSILEGARRAAFIARHADAVFYFAR